MAIVVAGVAADVSSGRDSIRVEGGFVVNFPLGIPFGGVRGMGDKRRSCVLLVLLCATADAVWSPQACAQRASSAIESKIADRDLKPLLAEFVGKYCANCHSQPAPKAGLALDKLITHDVPQRSEAWERVVRKLRARQMPPGGVVRPTADTYRRIVARLTAELDRAAAAAPHSGRTASLRRLNRTEYQNAIRDLLWLRVDVSRMLPPDDSGHGFDNVTVAELSPTLLSRYVTAAERISRLAVGTASKSPGGDTFRLPADFTQEERVEGLPIGTRGGTRIDYVFPQDGEYEIRVRLARDRNEEVEGLNGKHELEVLLDRRRVRLFTIKPPADANHALVDAGLRARIRVPAGPHQLGVTFLKKPSALLETKRQPFDAHFNRHRHPRLTPAVYQVSINGPYQAAGPGDTATRRRVFVCRPANRAEERQCAERILRPLMRRAYRRPIQDNELRTPMRFFEQGRLQGDFDDGIAFALSSVLVSPQFLFRIERDPPHAPPGSVYRISDLELASRLSFFLWSSLPDDPLLTAAERSELRQPETLRRHVRRMLSDRRADNLATNFAAQWLQLRLLDTTTPDLRRFPDFDDNLRQAFRRETELLVRNVIRQDRSLLDLLKVDYSFLNERLAKHYGIPHVYGSRFRRVDLGQGTQRGGLLRHGSMLTVTSYATRTSPVLRGHWVLKNLLGAAPPPPPPGVEPLQENSVAASLPVRQQLAAHRQDTACAGCHRVMDPIGFALEEFDAVGRWRATDAGRPIDLTGTLFDDEEFTGVAGLEQALLKHPDMYLATLAEKMLTFALGRGLTPDDAPVIREIVRKTRRRDDRFSELVMAIVASPPFQMRTTE